MFYKKPRPLDSELAISNSNGKNASPDASSAHPELAFTQAPVVSMQLPLSDAGTAHTEAPGPPARSSF